MKYLKNTFKTKRYNHFMIINKKTYQTLIHQLINHFDYILIRFHIKDNQISSELVVLQNIEPYLYHLKKHLYIVIYDAKKYHKKSENYIEYLQSIKENKLSYIDSLEFSYIVDMLNKDYPTFEDFLYNAEIIENEIAIIKKTTDDIKSKLSTIQKKLNKLVDYSFTKGDMKELENFKIEEFQKYLTNHLNPEKVEIKIDENLLYIKEQISELKEKLQKLIDVREIAPVDIQISEIKKQISKLKKEEQFYKNDEEVVENKPKPITLKERETLKNDYLNSNEFKVLLEIKKQELRRKNIELYLQKEQIKELTHLFIDDYKHLISNNKKFETAKPTLIKEVYKKHYSLNKDIFIKQGKIPPKIKTYSKNIYSVFQREIITINLYDLEYTYNMEPEVEQALKKVYDKSDRQFTNLYSNEEIILKIFDLEALEAQIEHTSHNDFNVNRDFFNSLITMGIEGNDWQEQAKEQGIEIPYEHIFGEEVEYLEDIASEIEIFRDDITINQFNDFIKNNSLNNFHTS